MFFFPFYTFYATVYHLMSYIFICKHLIPITVVYFYYKHREIKVLSVVRLITDNNILYLYIYIFFFIKQYWRI